jgi:hypothetical protein
MIASFFQRLESDGVEYLLISGQATILYGAATFSEDVDLWLRPTAPNLLRFVDALRSVRARYYKLTPPLSTENLARGHGFHFTLPGDAQSAEVYLDVMGKPPRVAPFDEALQRARYFDTDFGRVCTVGIKDLVEIKKTQRIEDYPIIGRLALVHLEELPADEVAGELPWAIDNIFTLPELSVLLERYPTATKVLASLPEPFPRLAQSRVAEQVSGELEDEVDAALEAKASAPRRADRRYWKAIIDELRDFKRTGRLLEEGSLV